MGGSTPDYGTGGAHGLPQRENIIIGVTIGGWFFVLLASSSIASFADNHGFKILAAYGLLVFVLVTCPIWIILSIFKSSVRQEFGKLLGECGKLFTVVGWGFMKWVFQKCVNGFWRCADFVVKDLGGKLTGFWDRTRKREMEKETETELGVIQGDK